MLNVFLVAVVNSEKFFSETSFSLINLLPIPTQTTPASSHCFRLSSVGETPPVGMIEVQGCGAKTPLTNCGPYTSPGNNFTISQPNSSAFAISVKEPQPGDQSTFLRLQTIAISSLKTGVTMKWLPIANTVKPQLHQ